jgi:DNA-directed RNA polymerase subunit F
MPVVGIEYAERFAKLVAKHEREACAEMLEAASKTGKIISCTSAAEAIRAKGQA